jgi:hypothetical protein
MYTAKELYKLADHIRDELLVLHGQRYRRILEQINNSFNQLSEIVQTCKRLARSLDHNWLIAAESCHDRIHRDLYTLSYTVGNLYRYSEAPRISMPTVRSIYDELRQVQEDFDEFTFDLKTNRLSVETPSVELEGTYLGPFEIQIEITNLWKHANNLSYRVIAREPHPASSNEDVTHPHVSGERLCEGEGAAAITMALHEGRLYDFFTLVTNILNTYNPDSAYVSLENWVSRTCYECGGEMSEDEVYICQRCGNEFCESCSSYCRCCDSTVCLNCMDRCAICGERTCDHCLVTCKECGRSICVACMGENVKICPDCQESEENQNDESSGNNETVRETRKDGNEPCENNGIPVKGGREGEAILSPASK